MQILTPEDQQRLQAELSPGEQILWSGKPNRKVILHPSDWQIIPFSLLWTGFLVFWELSAAGWGPMSGKGQSLSLELWGIPFIVYGQYFVWGRFFYAYWKKDRIAYALTDRRVLVTVGPPNAEAVDTFIESIPTIEKHLRSDGIGTLSFASLPPAVASGRRQKTASADGLHLGYGFPVFVDIDDAQTVYALVTDLRARANRTP